MAPLVVVPRLDQRQDGVTDEEGGVGACREASDIADVFGNEGTRLGLVQDGILTATGETLDEVIARVLGPSGEGAPLFTATPGWLTLGVRGSYALTDRQNITFALNNFTDLNYRLHGSGFDGLGINVTVAYALTF